MPASKPQPVAYSYTRFSTPEQSRGDSLRRQTEAAAEWCERNGVRLDTAHRLSDLGVSGFTGAHRAKVNVDRYALAGFLAMVSRGVVPPRSYLIVENLDRLTREDVRPALTLILNLIEAGIRIVQLTPETILDESADEMKLMTVIMELRRGNGESARKSERLGAVWKQKRKLAAESGRLITGKLPFWLNKTPGGSVAVIPEKAAVVRRIFSMSLEGQSLTGIARTLNAEGLLWRRSHWRTSHVSYLLNSRIVFGEFQPHTGKHPSRKPAGPPLPGYYPAVIDERLFFSVQAGLRDRHQKIGQPGKLKVNVFSGLLNDARTSTKLTYTVAGGYGRKLVSVGALDGLPGCRFLSFPADVFEETVLAALCEVDPSDLFPAEDSGTALLGELAGRIAVSDEQLIKLKAGLKRAGNLDTLIDAIAEVEAERKELAARLSDERQRVQAQRPADGWAELTSLAARAAEGDDATRQRIRTAVRRVVADVWCVFLGTTANDKSAFVQVRFGGGAVRNYVICHRHKHGGGRKARTWREVWRTEEADALDLSRAETRAALLPTVELGLSAFRERCLTSADH